MQEKTIRGKHGQNRIRLDPVADIDVQFVDRQAVDQRLYINFVHGPDGAGGDDAVHEIACCGVRDDDGRQVLLFDRFLHFSLGHGRKWQGRCGKKKENKAVKLDFMLHVSWLAQYSIACPSA
ncbi:hypothetical protein D3C87_1644520 [compost metagenome]